MTLTTTDHATAASRTRNLTVVAFTAWWTSVIPGLDEPTALYGWAHKLDDTTIVRYLRSACTFASMLGAADYRGMWFGPDDVPAARQWATDTLLDR